MAFAPNIAFITTHAQRLMDGAMQSVKGLLGYSEYYDFSPEAVLQKTKNIDPRFIAQAPMSNENLDVHTLSQLGSLGLKRGKEITAQSHPEFYQAFAAMSARAGLAHTPQLILAESKTLNALTFPTQEMVVTTGLLQAMDLREVSAVLGHELGHGSSDHTTPRVWATRALQTTGIVAGGYFAHNGGFGKLMNHDVANPGLLRRFGTWVLGRGDKPLSVLSSLIAMIVGLNIGSIVANQVSVRPTELEADRKGAMISGDPEGMISALQKLEASRKAGPVASFIAHLCSGYPSTEKRISSLRNMIQSGPVTPTPAPVAEVAPLNVAAAGVSPTALITGAALAERVGTPVTPALAGG